MPPKKPVRKPVLRVTRCQPWDGVNRRKPAAVNWWPTRIGVALIGAGIAIRVILRERFDVVPLALIIVGGAMIDKDAVKAASKMFSIRRGERAEDADTQEIPRP